MMNVTTKERMQIAMVAAIIAEQHRRARVDGI